MEHKIEKNSTRHEREQKEADEAGLFYEKPINVNVKKDKLRAEELVIDLKQSTDIFNDKMVKLTGK